MRYIAMAIASICIIQLHGLRLSQGLQLPHMLSGTYLLIFVVDAVGNLGHCSASQHRLGNRVSALSVTPQPLGCVQ